ncbi:MAG: transglycosylase SLT domain-containing protein [Pseudomonadota bacterium]
MNTTYYSLIERISPNARLLLKIITLAEKSVPLSLLTEIWENRAKTPSLDTLLAELTALGLLQKDETGKETIYRFDESVRSSLLKWRFDNTQKKPLPGTTKPRQKLSQFYLLIVFLIAVICLTACFITTKPTPNSAGIELLYNKQFQTALHQIATTLREQAQAKCDSDCSLLSINDIQHSLAIIIKIESNWQPTAQNPISRASGITQITPLTFDDLQNRGYINQNLKFSAIPQMSAAKQLLEITQPYYTARIKAYGPTVLSSTAAMYLTNLYPTALKHINNDSWPLGAQKSLNKTISTSYLEKLKQKNKVELYELYDLNGNGHISQREATAAITAMNNPSLHDKQARLTATDKAYFAIKPDYPHNLTPAKILKIGEIKQRVRKFEQKLKEDKARYLKQASTK